MLWERKIQLAKETRSELKKQNEELQKLKMVVRKKEVCTSIISLHVRFSLVCCSNTYDNTSISGKELM